MIPATSRTLNRVVGGWHGDEPWSLSRPVGRMARFTQRDNDERAGVCRRGTGDTRAATMYQMRKVGGRVGGGA